MPALDDREAYSTLNMGAGFALFVPAQEAEDAVRISREQGIAAWVAGTVEAGPKCLRVEPLGFEYGAEDLALR
jgi:phosphoribosylformylglycinamidine cyclo-ligase